MICLPSLYIFTCLSGSRRGWPRCGLLIGLVMLMTILLVGFAPVAWLFSQSTESVAWMGALHLVFWGIRRSSGYVSWKQVRVLPGPFQRGPKHVAGYLRPGGRADDNGPAADRRHGEDVSAGGEEVLFELFGGVHEIAAGGRGGAVSAKAASAFLTRPRPGAGECFVRRHSAVRDLDNFLRVNEEGRAIGLPAAVQVIWLCGGVIVAGGGAYGAAMGSWWAPLQAGYVAIELPLLIRLTTLGDGLLNGMLAPLLGLRNTFRQMQTAVLLSFAIAAAILAALSPVALFVVWNTPALNGSSQQPRRNTASCS